jgi:hypothetical protein
MQSITSGQSVRPPNAHHIDSREHFACATCPALTENVFRVGDEYICQWCLAERQQAADDAAERMSA